ncbi:MAG: hypothetical protein ABI364_00040, partial [Caldimonas sp.]
MRRIIRLAGGARKSLISLRSQSCRESVQAVRKRDWSSVSGRAGPVTHKVIHRLGGLNQIAHQIIDLQPEREAV